MRIEAVVLENGFVRLEPIAERHRAALRAAGNDADLWRFASVNQHNEDFNACFDERLAATADAKEVCFVITDKASSACAGSSSYLAINLANRRLEIGWTWYSKRFWAGAVNPATKRLMMTHGFDALALNRIELKLDATNKRSWRAVEKLGAVHEGVHRHHMVLPDGRLRDTAWFSVLKSEWPEVRAGLDRRLASISKDNEA